MGMLTSIIALLAVVGVVVLLFMPGLWLIALLAVIAGLLLAGAATFGRGSVGGTTSDVEERRREHEHRHKRRRGGT